MSGLPSTSDRKYYRTASMDLANLDLQLNYFSKLVFQGPSVPLDVRRFEGEQAERNNAALKQMLEELPYKSREEKLRDAFAAMGRLHNIPSSENRGRSDAAIRRDDA
jgi:hypothetical protein